MAKQTKCTECLKSKEYFEGCSRVECPMRKTITARHLGEYSDNEPYAPIAWGCRVKTPTNKE